MNKAQIGMKTRILVKLLSSLSFSFLLLNTLALKMAVALEISQIFKPPDNGKPGDSSGAGSRDQQRCPSDKPDNSASFVAIVPKDSVGLTVSEHPRFWVYIPPTSAQVAVLSMQTPEKSYQVQTSVTLTGKGEIVGLTLSKDFPSLEMGKTYQWVVVLVCGSQPSLNDPVVKALVRRVNQSEPLPSNSSELTQVFWYGKQGIWYDALNILIQAKEKQPSSQEIENAWRDLLKSADLEQIASEEIRF